MDTKHAAGSDRRVAGTRQRFFTVESANQALVLVGKVVRDIVGAYGELMSLRAERQELALAPDAHEQLGELSARIDQLAERVKRLREELTDVGCEPKDLSRGLVDFPVWFEGRKVLLCWQLGEPEVGYWHDLNAGFAGRRPIDAEFRRRAGEPLSSGIDESTSR